MLDVNQYWNAVNLFEPDLTHFMFATPVSMRRVILFLVKHFNGSEIRFRSRYSTVTYNCTCRQICFTILLHVNCDLFAAGFRY